MVNTLPDLTFDDTLPSSHWNTVKNGVQDVTPAAAGGRIVGTGPSTAPIEIVPPMIIITDPPYRCAGDGTTDNTTALQQAFDDADTSGKAVFIPEGTFKTGKINYRMQSVIGVSTEKSILKGLPGQDILNVDPTLTQFYRSNGIFENLTLMLDDTVNAAASFPQRGGVGNACYAIDYPDKNATARASAVNWHHRNLRFTSTSATTGGQNNSCGIYTQNNHFTQNYMSVLEFSYLKYGWRDHYPTSNFTPYVTSFSRDHCSVNFLHFLRCGYQWTTYGWGIGFANNIMFHGGPSIVDLDSDWNHMHVNGVEMVGNSSTLNWLQSTRSYKNQYTEFTHSLNNVPMQWNEYESEFSGNFNRQPNVLPNIQINNNWNKFFLRPADTALTNYGYDYVDDRGLGNFFDFGWRNSTLLFGRMAGSPDNRMQRQRDSVSLLNGIVDPPFVSADDLLINPRYLKLASGTQGTNWDYIYDSTITPFRLCFRRLGSGTQATFDTNTINGIAGFNVGNFLPATRIKVYVKHRSDAAGTITWTMQGPIGTTRGASGTVTNDTTWRVTSFDVDLSAVTSSDTLRLTSGFLTGGQTYLDIAYIFFRPWTNGALDSMMGMSGDVGDASKTLVVGTDQYVQRWNTPLTAARTVTLPTSATVGVIQPNARFRINREAGATGAFNLTINPPAKVLATAGNWAEFMYDSPNNVWRVIGGGTL